MRIKFIILFSLLTSIVAAQTHKVNIKGFGEMTATKLWENTYSINMGKYGTFQCQGKLDPLYLEIKTSLDSLREFPGYELYEKLDLEDVEIFLAEDEVSIGASIGTKKNFGPVMKMFKIPNPTIGVEVKLTRTSFELSGELDFEEEPIVLDVVPDFSRFTLENFGIGATWEKGDGEIELSVGVAIQTRWKPTSWDPDVQSVIAFDYNLMSNTLEASISMTDAWTNPMLMNKLLKPNSVSFTNVSASLEWPIGAPAPTAFGFVVEQAKFFQLDFAVKLAMTPADKKIALYAYRNELTMNDFSRILRDGFGLNVPDLFPNDMYIKDAEILFSPNGGEVGEFDIPKGFAFRGTARMLDVMNAQVNFKANFDDGFYLYYNMDAAFKTYFENVFRNDPKLKYISGELIKTFNVKKVMLEAQADMSLNMGAKTHCEFTVLGQNVKFAIEGEFSVEALKNKMLDEIKKIAGPEVAAVLDAVGKGVAEAGKVAGAIAGTGSNLAKKYVKLGTTKAQHIHLTQGGEKYCRAHCIPNRANELVDRILPSSKSAIQLFYDMTLPDLVEIEGDTKEETRKLREAVMINQWNDLVNKIEGDWNNILEDKEYVGFFVDPKWAENGGEQFRGIIRKRKQEYDQLRDRLLNQLLWASMVQPYTYTQIQMHDSEKFLHVENGPVSASKIAPGWHSAMWIIEPVPGTQFVKIKNRWKQTYLNVEHGKLESSAIKPDWHSAMWEFEQVSEGVVRIKNRWKQTYIHAKNGELQASKVALNEPTAQWKLNHLYYSNKVWNTDGYKSWAAEETLLVSANQKYKLVFQQDGNLVIYKYNVIPVWHTETYGKGAVGVRFETSGFMAVHNGRQTLWSSQSANKGGQTLYLQDDGNLVIHAPGANVIWASGSVDNPILYNRYVKIQHVNTGNFLHTENGLGMSAIQPGWWSAQWIFEPIAGSEFVWIKNRHTGGYLHIEGGQAVQCTPIQPGWHSAQWKLEHIAGTNQIRIRNRWHKDDHLCFTDRLYCFRIPANVTYDRWVLDNMEPVRMSVKYEAENGCGKIYKDGVQVARHCGWSKSWHTVLMAGCTDVPNVVNKVLFYDNNVGRIEFYKLNTDGGMQLLKGLDGIAKTWERISWEQTGKNLCEGVIKFELANGYWEKYICDHLGNINLHSKKQ